MKRPKLTLGYFNKVFPPSLQVPLTQESEMAKKKVAKKKAAPKKAARKKATKVGKGVETNPTKPLPTMDDIDERVPEIDTILEKIFANDARRESLKQENEKLKVKLCPLMSERKIDSYKTPIGSVYVQHGEDVIVLKKTKKK